MSLKVVKFVVENYKAIKGRKEFETPGGASFYLFAGNGQGKTSFGGALSDILTKNYPSKPITEGAHEGYVEITFSDGSKAFTRFLDNGKKPVLEIVTPEGYEIGSPKKLVEELIGNGMDFKVDELFTLEPAKLREKMQKIAGLDLSQLNAREKKAFDERTDANRRLKDQLAKVKDFDAALAAKEPQEAVKLIESVALLERQANDQVAYRKHLEGLKTAKTDLADELANLMILVENKKADIKENAKRIKDGEQWFCDNPAPTEEDLVSAREALNNLEADNAKIAEAKRLKKEFDLSVEYQNDADNLDELVNSIRADKIKAIKAAPLPAEGLAFDPDGNLTLNGIPFEDNQIAHSAKIIAGVQIAASMLGTIKFLHFDAAPLDKANIDRVFKYAEEIGLQLCVEYPLFEGGELKMEIHESK